MTWWQQLQQGQLQEGGEGLLPLLLLVQVAVALLAVGRGCQ
jgi:hypothetical protein